MLQVEERFVIHDLELPHERRHFERAFASPIMSPDAAGPLPREGRKGECLDEFSVQTGVACARRASLSDRYAAAEVGHPR